METAKTMLAIYLIFCGVLSCQSQDKQMESYEGYPLPVTDEFSRVEIQEFSNDLGTYYFYYLKEPTEILSIPCKDHISLRSDGMIHGFILSRDHEINGTLIPEGSRYERHSEDDYMIHLSRDITIQGIPITHRQAGLFIEGVLSFYADGTLEGFNLAEDMTISGYPCNGGNKNSSVFLYRNGALYSCNLSENMVIDGIPCQGGGKSSKIWLRPNGQLMAGTLSEDVSINDTVYDKGTQLVFDKDGDVHFLSGRLHFLSFHENGNPHNCVIDKDDVMKGMHLKKHSRIIFDEKGTIEAIRPTNNVEINGVPCRRSKWLHLYPNGNVETCILSEDYEIRGVVYKKGTEITLYENGKGVLFHHI